MSGPASSRPWFCCSLSLAPALVRERLGGLPEPAVPGGEGAEALDVDLVYDVAAPEWHGRVARLVDGPGQRVLGRLRPVPPALWPQVVALEERLALASLERTVRVRTASGALVTARALTPPAPPRAVQAPVSETFLVALARAAESAKLPADYVLRLHAEARLVQTVQRARTERPR